MLVADADTSKTRSGVSETSIYDRQVLTKMVHKMIH